jgi:hypothetical protein
MVAVLAYRLAREIGDVFVLQEHQFCEGLLAVIAKQGNYYVRY